MFDSLGKFLRAFFLKIMVKLPESPFDYEQVVDHFEEYIGKINYFVPFYEFVRIFNVWVVTVFASFGLYLLFKFMKQLMGK